MGMLDESDSDDEVDLYGKEFAKSVLRAKRD